VESTVNLGDAPVVELNLQARSVTYSKKLKSHRDIKEIAGDEEMARAFLVNRLVRVLEYKPEMIELEKEYAAGRKPKLTPRIDLILKDSTGNPFFFVECKDPTKYEAERLAAIRQQLFGLAPLEQGQTGKKVKYLVYYTVETRGEPVRDRAIIIDYAKYPTFDAWNEAGQPSIGDSLPEQYNQPQKTPLSRGGKRDLRKEFDQKEIKALATELHDVLWAVVAPATRRCLAPS